MSSTLPFPRTDYEFYELFPNDHACIEYLTALRWPDGFVCPHCESHEGYWNQAYPLFAGKA